MSDFNLSSTKLSGNNLIAGMDEAGRGPVLGPIVFGIVIATKKQLNKLKKMGVDDSKQLSRAKRESMEEIIKKNVLGWGTYSVSASEIDEQRASGTNLNLIEVNSFKSLLANFSEHIATLQLDAADVNAERFGSHFSSMINGKIQSMHKGDSHFVSVGAASILAKVRRDNIMSSIQEKYSQLNPSLPKVGSGYPNDVTKKFLQAYYSKYDELPIEARHSWKTSKAIIEGKNQSKLDDYF